MTQGEDVAALQSSRDHQENSGEKSGAGLGFGDSVSTVVEGMKWFLTSSHEGAMGAYANVLSGLVDSGVLVTMFGKSGNMLGIKLLEGIEQYLSGGDGEGMPQEQEGMHPEQEHHPDDYSHANDGIAQNANGLNDMDYSGDHHGQSYSPSPSPSVGGHDHGHELGD